MPNPILTGRVVSAAPGLKGFDANSIISLNKATTILNSGYSFCARYLSRSTTQGPNDLSFSEANDILNSGLALMAVQHVAAPGWHPNSELGMEYGTNAALNAVSVGLPKGMNIWCDLEGIAIGTLATDVINYCQSWYAALHNAGYVPGLYVGADCILTGQQLFQDLSFQHYWKSLSRTPIVEKRGFQIIQNRETRIFNVDVDIDITQNDNLGGTVLWLVR